MLEQLRSKYSYLNDEQWSRFLSLFQEIKVPAKTILLREGDVARKAFFIISGCIRVWFNNNGRDTTFQFFFEGQGISSLESFKKNIPSFFTIETIEPCTLYWISKENLEAITKEMEHYAPYHEQMLEFIFERQFHYMKEFLSFIKDTPVERYKNLVANKPQILLRVPQQYIASYLGITSVSLSRIRARLLREK